MRRIDEVLRRASALAGGELPRCPAARTTDEEEQQDRRGEVVTGPGGEGEGPGVKMLPAFCTDLRGKVLIEGAGHWNQQEAPEATNKGLLEFLGGLKR